MHLCQTVSGKNSAALSASPMQASEVISRMPFDCTRLQPSGQWGVEDTYAFLLEAYQTEFSPPLIAIARPHHIIWAGQQATLDASRSLGNNLQYQWTFTEGGSASGAKVTRAYNTPGYFSEIVKVTDADGNVDYDFTTLPGGARPAQGRSSRA